MLFGESARVVVRRALDSRYNGGNLRNGLASQRAVSQGQVSALKDRKKLFFLIDRLVMGFKPRPLGRLGLGTRDWFQGIDWLRS